MITELCLYLNNWFDYEQPKYFGQFTVEDGVLVFDGGDMDIADGQYYRIIGSKFNDRVYKHGSEDLVAETFNGAVWLMAIPRDVVSLATEIEAWQTQYGEVTMSPYQSESFGGYSYSKASGGSSTVPTWQSTFKSRLSPWRKIKV